MMAAPNKNLDRLISAIKFSGYMTSMDLKDETGINEKHQGVLRHAINRGLITMEKVKIPGRRECNAYRWVGDIPARPGAGPDPKKRAQRTCLCCGASFASESAMNRLCGRCKGAASRDATPFDIPATTRYR